MRAVAGVRRPKHAPFSLARGACPGLRYPQRSGHCGGAAMDSLQLRPIVFPFQVLLCRGGVMNKLVFGGVAFVAFTSASAWAADIAPVYRPAPAAVLATNWSGLYVGGNAGY